MEYSIILPNPKRIILSNPYTDIDKFINKSGIYIFYSEYGKCLYIGKSMNLSTRIKSHLFNKSTYNIEYSFNHFFNNFKKDFYYIVDIIEVDKKDLDMYETLLINKLKPFFNIQYNDNQTIIEFKRLYEKINYEVSGKKEYYCKKLIESL